MEVIFPFGVVNTCATAVIIVIILLDIIVYKLRQLHEANFGKNSEISSSSSSSSSSQQLSEANHGQNSSNCRQFSLAEVRLATNNFDDTLVIGHGGFGKVYKGVIDDGMVTVAIKRLSSTSKQGAPQFWTEVQLLSKFRHSHLVSLIGYCSNRDEKILVYEYMARGSLADHLYKVHPNGNNSLTLSWVYRLKICIGAARGLDYLHTGTGIHDRVIHRDLKSANILLDDSWAAKVSDFGLSKIGPANQSTTRLNTNVKGTFGYVDPEYFMTHMLTRKSDVYSFGVVLLEVLSGRRAMNLKLCEEQRSLAGWAKECIKKGEVDQIIDLSLKQQILPNSLAAFVQIADHCLHYRSKKRPTMAEVVASLESALALQERRDSSMFEDYTFDNQENLDDSLGQPEAGNGEHQVKEIHNIVLSGTGTDLLGLSWRLPKIWKRIKKKFFQRNGEFLGMDTRLYTFTYAALRGATDDFNPINKLGEGGYGPVYKGTLDDGSVIAVKQLSVASHQAKSQFVAEIATISAVQHRNLVKLYGYCIKANKRLIVYEYLKNKSLDQALFGKSSLHLNWPTRFNICLGVAKGLNYLHEESRLRIIHRDVKTSNILLDHDLDPKISNFGLAKLYNDRQSHVSTCVAGTIGYLAPEYAMRGHLTEKADVFGFGVVALEIISGRRNYDSSLEEEKMYLLEWAWNLHESNREVQLVDSNLSMFDGNEVKRMIGVALLCTQPSPTLRPSMSRVVAMLLGDIEVSNIPTRPSYLIDWNDTTSLMSSDTSISKNYRTPYESLTNIVTNHSAVNASQPMLAHEIVEEGR